MRKQNSFINMALFGSLGLALTLGACGQPADTHNDAAGQNKGPSISKEMPQKHKTGKTMTEKDLARAATKDSPVTIKRGQPFIHPQTGEIVLPRSVVENIVKQGSTANKPGVSNTGHVTPTPTPTPKPTPDTPTPTPDTPTPNPGTPDTPDPEPGTPDTPTPDTPTPTPDPGTPTPTPDPGIPTPTPDPEPNPGPGPVDPTPTPDQNKIKQLEDALNAANIKLAEAQNKHSANQQALEQANQELAKAKFALGQAQLLPDGSNPEVIAALKARLAKAEKVKADLEQAQKQIDQNLLNARMERTFALEKAEQALARANALKDGVNEYQSFLTTPWHKLDNAGKCKKAAHMMASLVNNYRISAGLKSVPIYAEGMEEAKQWADQLPEVYGKYTGMLGQEKDPAVTSPHEGKLTGNYRYSNENVAFNSPLHSIYYDRANPASEEDYDAAVFAMFEQWVHSPGHNKGFLKKDTAAISIGINFSFIKEHSGDRTTAVEYMFGVMRGYNSYYLGINEYAEGEDGYNPTRPSKHAEKYKIPPTFYEIQKHSWTAGKVLDEGMSWENYAKPYLNDEAQMKAKGFYLDPGKENATPAEVNNDGSDTYSKVVITEKNIKDASDAANTADMAVLGAEKQLKDAKNEKAQNIIDQASANDNIKDTNAAIEKEKSLGDPAVKQNAIKEATEQVAAGQDSVNKAEAAVDESNKEVNDAQKQVDDLKAELDNAKQGK